jgi:ELWxxDGT repeat protein
LYFTADDGSHGRELWKSDGTAAGTVLVKNIDPGVSSYGPSSLTAVGDTLFFAADDTHGQALWKSNGTKAGTVRVKNIKRAADSGYGYGLSSLTAVGGKLFFTADDGVHATELWKSNGRKRGTVLVKDINTGTNTGYYGGSYPLSSNPAHLTAVGGKLFFSADDNTHGRELWKSNGSKRGTVLVRDLDPRSHQGYYGPSPASSDPSSLAAVGGKLFLAAADRRHGQELWRSNGTKRGTVLVKDIRPGGSGSSPSSVSAMGGTSFFTAGDRTHGRELWRSDGTKRGTVLVKDINPGAGGAVGGGYDYGSSALVPLGRTLFFAADDGTHGPELWKSDGSRSHTVLVENIRTGDYGSDPSSLTAVGTTLFFTARDGTHGMELWRSNGSSAGTFMVKDIHPCSVQSGPSSLTRVGKTLFFAADDGTHGMELWRSNGTRSGTVMVKDINASS